MESVRALQLVRSINTYGTGSLSTCAATACKVVALHHGAVMQRHLLSLLDFQHSPIKDGSLVAAFVAFQIANRAITSNHGVQRVL